MAFWENRPASAENLRLFVPNEGWRIYSDKTSESEKIDAVGSRRLVESAFLNSLNSTNLALLTGTGASFAAHNPETLAGTDGESKLTPAGMPDLWQAVVARVGTDRFEAVCAQFQQATIGDNIERLLTFCKLFLELNETADNDQAKAIKTFVADAERAILKRVDFVDADTFVDAHATVIQKIGRRGVRKPRARFFTTNYDLCFEEAARRHRFTIMDGFSHALDQIYDRAHFDYDIVRREQGRDNPDYIENVFHLYKLHGSIDWRRIRGEVYRSRDETADPVLIFPRSSKYQESFEAPYLDMIGAFQAVLRERDTAIIVCGFGFNDDHVSRPVLAAVEANMSMRIIVCDPLFLTDERLEEGAHIITDTKKTENRFVKQIVRLAESGDPRIHLINGRFEDMALALPDLVGETDRERHVSRIRSLRDESGGAS